MLQTISELTEQEESWITQQIEEAGSFINRFSPSDSASPPTLAAADRAFKAWLAIDDTATDSLNKVINAVGVLFGQAPVDRTDLRWVIATDEQGTELAVFGLPGAGDVLVYPTNFVAKRWERRETDSLQRSLSQISGDVRRLAQWLSEPKP